MHLRNQGVGGDVAVPKIQEALGSMPIIHKQSTVAQVCNPGT